MEAYKTKNNNDIIGTYLFKKGSENYITSELEDIYKLEILINTLYNEKENAHHTSNGKNTYLNPEEVLPHFSYIISIFYKYKDNLFRLVRILYVLRQTKEFKENIVKKGGVLNTKDKEFLKLLASFASY
jgi:hypothetical protein